jgi:hypothetical protein
MPEDKRSRASSRRYSAASSAASRQSRPDSASGSKPQLPAPWKVGPGLKSTLVTNFQQAMGVPNLIPLFVPVNPPNIGAPSPGSNYVAASNTGQNATYAIIGFAGVTVTQATGDGNNMVIAIQPSAVLDPTAVLTNLSPARATQQTWFGTSQTTFVSAKLTR